MNPERTTAFISHHFPFTVAEPFFLREVVLAERLPITHLHEGVEIGVVLSPRVTMILGRTRYSMKHGDAYFLDSTIPHGHEGGTVQVCECETAVLASAGPIPGDMRLLRPFIALRKGVNPVVKKCKTVCDALGKALAVYRNAGSDRIFLSWPHVLAAFTAIACSIGNAHPESTEKTPGMRTIATALAYIREHFAQDLSVADMAVHCCLSESRFAHSFSEQMGISPLEYRNRLRIGRAMDLIVDGAKIEQAAFDTGFSSLSHFASLFKKITGHSPGSIRNH